MEPMLRDDPQRWALEPVRRALDGVLYRWVALFGTAVAAALVHALNGGAQPIDRMVHIGLPAFLAVFVLVHLVGLIWRRHGATDGWEQASSADHATVLVARSVGWVILVGAALAVVAPLGTLSHFKAFWMEVLLWFPLYFPLYCAAVWLTIGCARDRLGRGVEESQRRLHQYWRDLSRSAKPGAAG
jgi:hypothetical protein